ncbi:MAG: PDZ domain-containing protein, partial [Bacteroidales bacterium]|nr:PDZ domain-containing protein [Bacteroidales bacterium]
MKKLTNFIACIILLLTMHSKVLLATNTNDTKLLSQPAISQNNIAFIYAEDLWVANIDGSVPRRLTIDVGIESDPVFSPDGKLIAFSAEYDGNTDVFIVPVEGGVPKRLTWHPDADFVRGFSVDGQSVLFASRRTTYTNRYFQLYTISVNGGFPTKLEIPNAWRASYSDDGKSMAFTPIYEAFNQWKNYRGGTTSNILLFSFQDNSVIKIPQPDGGCNDTDPMWVDDHIYFRSDRNGEFNLFSYQISNKEIKQLTDFKDFPVISASKGKKQIIFEQAGYLHTFDMEKGTEKKLKIGIATDLLELRTRYIKGGNYIRSGSISPSGARAVFDFRGEIITVPAEKGDPRNLTQTSGAHEKYPAWSPDGKSIAYFSDGSGEYQLFIQPQDGKGKTKIFNLSGTGFYAYLHWSPDSKKLCYSDNGRNLYLFDAETGTNKKIDSDELYVPGAFRDLFGDWAFDSKWIVYTKIMETNFSQVYIYSLETGKSIPLTDGLSNTTDPRFDRSGKYLYFFASTDAGPVVNWFDQSSIDMEMTNSIYLITLRKDIISPLAKENDEEGTEEKNAESNGKENNKKSKKEKSEENSKTEALKIDFDGITQRIVSLPIKEGNYSQLNVGAEGQVLYIASSSDNSNPPTLHKYDISERKDKEIMEMDEYTLSANGKKMMFYKGNSIGITNTGEKPEEGKGILNTETIEVKVDPVAEWTNIFNEAWRINRDYFYDPGMHGADWQAMKKKYEPFLADLSCRSDLNLVIQWMCSELAVGHHRLTGRGEQLHKPDRVPGGLLGADIKINNNRYQITKIFGGLNWNPELRSPLTEPGVNAKAGDYILAVNGEEVTANKSFYSYFENTADKIVELTIGPNPDFTGSRVVKIVPLRSEYALRNRDWVEGNLKKVNEATKGQVAYVYVPNTAGLGHT